MYQMYSDQTAYVVYLHDDNVNVLSGLVLFGKCLNREQRFGGTGMLSDSCW